jgi:hypothetical protein
VATRRSPTQAVLTAVVSRLQSTTGVTGRAPRGVYAHVPQATPIASSSDAYVVVAAVTGSRQDTYGRLGMQTLLQVRGVTVGDSLLPGVQLRDHVQRALTASAVTASEHTVLGLSLDGEESYTEILNGLSVHHHVSLVRVWTEQTTS